MFEARLLGEAAQIARDVSRAAGHFLRNQLPEFYAGIQRDGRNFLHPGAREVTRVRSMHGLPRARAREGCADFGVVIWGFNPKTGVVLSLLLNLPPLPGMPHIENGGTFAVDFADGRRDRHNINVTPFQLQSRRAARPGPGSDHRALRGSRPIDDGSARTLVDVVNFYDERFGIGLSAKKKQDLLNSCAACSLPGRVQALR
jgi:hypothetical protein